jgi:hypothetical protein
VQISDAGDGARRADAKHRLLARQYCRDNSQWARERSESALSPKGASALIA